MNWLLLIAAGLCEMLGVMSINYWNTKKNGLALFALISSFTLSFCLLFYTLKTLPMGTAYAIWTGIGAAGGSAAGMIWFHEPKNWQRIVCICIILFSVIGLKIVT